MPHNLLSMELKYHEPLRSYHTFGLDARTRVLADCCSADELREALRRASPPVLVLGGGSNVLFKGDFDGWIIRPRILGVELLEQTGTMVRIRAGAGEEWDSFVAWCVEQEYYGLENLSLIPGTVGASPIQNIGAYGVEAGHYIHSVEGIRIDSGEPFMLSARECRFGYRNSIFKQEYAHQCIITHVTFELSRVLSNNLSYSSVRDKVMELGGVTGLNIRKAIIAIRESKLPDPKVLGNAGSFFKNPEVDAAFAHQLLTHYPGMPVYPLDAKRAKLAAGWLIEQCGLKGYRYGAAGVHALQALVLVNYGGATGALILEVAQTVIDAVQSKFGIRLEMEVNVV